jgi:hypothetical protein
VPELSPFSGADRPEVFMPRLLALLPLGALALAGACASTIANRDPTGQLFPSVVGESLSGEEVRLPEALAGKKAILLVGYVMETQFDLDRWLLGLAQGEVPAPILEVPTIEGLLPGLFAGAIDSGMRSGIPGPLFSPGARSVEARPASHAASRRTAPLHLPESLS